MSKAIDAIGEMVREQISNGYPSYGAATFNKGLSNIHLEAIGDIKMGKLEPGSISPINVDEETFTNDTDEKDSFEFKYEGSTTSTFTWSLTEGAKVTGKFNAGIFSITAEVSFSASQSSTKSKTTSWSGTQNINVGARTEVHASAEVDQATYNVPFHAPVQARGLVVIDFANGQRFSHQISDLITKDGWNAPAFHTSCAGVFKGVHGNILRIKTSQRDKIKM